MKIFISHIQEEFQVAQVLKKWIDSAFSDRCEVLVSTDPENIPSVAQYLGENDQGLTDLKALIILCSPNSLRRPWISFEVGCAWMRKIFIIPVCYSGLSLDELPQPLAIFSGFDLNHKDFPQKFFSILAQELGISQLPPIQYRQMWRELATVQETLPQEVPTSVSGQGQAATPEGALESIHIEILTVLANSYGYTSTVLAEHFKMEEKKIMPLLKVLIDWNYIYASPAGMGHVRYNLTGKGKDYLKENDSA